MRSKSHRCALMTALVLGSAACQTTAQVSVRAALLLDDNERAIKAIQSTLEAVLKQGRVNLGPSELTRDAVITVLPPAPGPHEGNSPAMPRYFELVTDGKLCFLRERGARELHALAGVNCRAQ
jgi:hypothetical protein